MRHLLPAALALLLSACAQQVSVPRDSPLAGRLDSIEPGRTTRAELDALFGQPWITSTRWGAALYVDYTSYVDTVAITAVPVIPFGRHHEAETLLVIHDGDGIVLGLEYSGATDRCGKQGCRRGDLRGIDVRELQALLAPAGAPPTRPGSEECLLEVEALAKPVYNRMALLYVNGEFVQLVPAGMQARARLPLPAGAHQLACLTTDRSRKGLLLRPWHRLTEREPDERGWLDFADNLAEARFSCAQGERVSYRLVQQSDGWRGPLRCAIEQVGALPQAGARELILPDRPPAPVQ
jgi:hypothetical protein